MNDIEIGKVNDEGGCWSNMAAYPIEHEGKRWLTSEALFQAMRFEDEEIRELIRSQKSPFSAKMKAKKNKAAMVVVPMSDEDLDNMMLCLELKIEQHPELREMLIETGDAYMVENCTKRQTASGKFWGAALRDGYWEGQNWLGRLWMKLRSELIANLVS